MKTDKEAMKLAQPVQVPVAIVQTIGHKGGSFDWYAKLGEECCVGDLLYAAPPAQLAAPRTDEQIDELSRTMVKGSKSVNWLCRAIESAHNIGEKPDAP